MSEDTKQYVQLHLSLLKEVLREEGLIFGMVIDKRDGDNSKLAIVDKEKYLQTGKTEGIIVGLKELNEGLL